MIVLSKSRFTAKNDLGWQNTVELNVHQYRVKRIVMFVNMCHSRVAEVGVLAETAKYPSMLAQSARLQIFVTKNTVFYNCKFLQHTHRFLR